MFVTYLLTYLRWLLSNFGNPCSHDYRGMNCYPALSTSSCLFLCTDYKRSIFAFRSTGSPVAAIIYTIHTITVTQLLEKNPHVAVYAMDFSKAFELTQSITLPSLKKSSVFVILDHVYNGWSAYSQGIHIVQIHRHKVNTLEMIKASVIQGSGIIPTAFFTNAGELKSLITENVICKFADDTYTIIYGTSAVNIRTRELDNIQA